MTTEEALSELNGNLGKAPKDKRLYFFSYSDILTNR